MAALAVVLLVVVLGFVVVSAAMRPAASPTSSPFGSPTPAAAEASPSFATPFSPSPAVTSTASPPHPTPSLAPPSAGREPGTPDPSLTPGAVNPVVTPRTLATTICAKGWTAKIRPPSSYTTALKRQQIAQYGYTDTALAHYEEDHLVSLELGGAPRDPANLWPEPYSAALADGTPVGARVKDQLENRLNHLVCSGEMPLATAQHLIATHWIDAWRTYVAP
ncbi:MAG: hypothetical protein ACYDAN_15430 [Candidatus Limnocylindrales bacterium]